MSKGTQETISSDQCELFQPLRDRQPAIGDVDAPDKYVETMENESGGKVSKVLYRHEVFEGQQMNGSVQGCLKDPRDTPQVHND